MDMDKKFKELVANYGENDRLFTFNLCSDYGIELDHSTIDSVCIRYGDLRFYYNENEEDYGNLGDFLYDDLYQFYNAIESQLNHSSNEWIKRYVKSALNRLFEVDDAESICEDIFDDVVEDIRESADNNFNTSDIDIAISRVLKERMGY